MTAMAPVVTGGEAGLLLLLIRDLPSGRRDLQSGGPSSTRGTIVEERPLPGFEALAPRKTRRQPSHCAKERRTHPPDDPLLSAYLKRLAARGAAPKGFKAYRYQLRSTSLTAARLAGRTVTWADLVRNEGLLGRALVDDTAPTLGTRLSKWTLAQRRSAVRSFATLMRPELATLLGEDPHNLLDRALRSVAERVGTGYRLSGGAPRRRGGWVPTERDIGAVLDAVGRALGYPGARNRAFFAILSETGARVNALRELDGADCLEMPSGRLRIFLHEKGKTEPREVELSRSTSDDLQSYVVAFNRMAAIRRWRVRIRLSEPGAVWRNSSRGRWSYRDVRATFRRGCSVAQVPDFGPHALRRAFATDAASALPRHLVAQAGGWKGLERLDDHYIQPRGETIWDKLSRSWQPGIDQGTAEVERRETTPAL